MVQVLVISIRKVRIESNIPGQTSGSGILEIGRGADTSSVGAGYQYGDFIYSWQYSHGTTASRSSSLGNTLEDTGRDTTR